MIVEAILEVIIGAVKTLGRIILTLAPSINLTTYMTSFTIQILRVTTQANNMLHFILGDFVDVLVPFALTLLVYKYIMYPLLCFARSIFVNGNN